MGIMVATHEDGDVLALWNLKRSNQAQPALFGHRPSHDESRPDEDIRGEARRGADVKAQIDRPGSASRGGVVR